MSDLINVGALLQVIVTALIAGVLIVTLYALGIVAVSKAPVRARTDGKTEPADGNRALWLGIAGLCFLACAASIVIGVVIMLSKG
jgi:hypothetical protein